jgi:hypothetical protein
MKHAAEPATLDTATPSLPSRTIVPLPVEDAAGRQVRERLLRQLAADRLRDLRDDGVTTAYVARMYAVDPTVLEELQADLLPGGGH